jgi:hypothetical protein
MVDFQGKVSPKEAPNNPYPGKTAPDDNSNRVFANPLEFLGLLTLLFFSRSVNHNW